MIRHGMPALLVTIVFLIFAPVHAEEPPPVPVMVFPFELEDKSAGAGLIPPDSFDRRYLLEAAQVTRDMLAGTGRYHVLDVSDVAPPRSDREALRYCGGCEGALAKQHGAALAVLGVVTRVNRTEHTMFIRIIDADTGKPVAVGFTDLRMGANHAWPRTARWLMTRHILK